jgi:hypothetical protein
MSYEQMHVKIKNSDNQPDPNIYLVIGIKPPLVEIKNTASGKIIKVNQNRIIDVVDAPSAANVDDSTPSTQENTMAKKNTNKSTPATPAPVIPEPVVSEANNVEKENTVKTPDTVEELNALNVKSDATPESPDTADDSAAPSAPADKNAKVAKTAKTPKAPKTPKKVAIKAEKKPKVKKVVEKFHFQKYIDDGFEIFTKKAKFTNKGVTVKSVAVESHVLLAPDSSYYHTFNTYNGSLGKTASYNLSKFEIKDADSLTKKRTEWDKNGYKTQTVSETVS